MAQTRVTNQSPPARSEPRRVTLDEYLEMLDDAGYEVIDGELIPMTPQELESSRIAHDLYDALQPHVKNRKLGRVWMETVIGFEIDREGGWLRGSMVPDVAFMSAEHMKQQRDQFSNERVYRVAPDLAVEVVSPNDRFAAVLRKVARYLGYGVRLVWVIDPQNRVAFVYTPDQPDGRALHENDTLSGAPVLPDWSIALREVFDAGPS